MAAALPGPPYTRDTVRRLLDIPEKELSRWESEALVPRMDSYDFRDLVALRAIAQLREQRMPLARIGAIVAAVRDRLQHVENPLSDVKIVTEGRQVRVLSGGQTLEPFSGQLLLNFEAAELRRLVEFPAASASQSAQREQQRRRADAEQWFEKGVAAEQTGAPLDHVLEAYKQAAELDPQFAGPLVNLGTVYFRLRRWREAEQYYRQALQVDPAYPLAHFNLANLYDERGERTKALTHYQTALQLKPQYADAHYNIALLYQTLGQSLKAVHHWQAFLKLDPAGSWADIARAELEKLRRHMVVRGARQTPARTQDADTAR